jgi:tetratricopeptide (TPR) repeat protein
MSVMERDPLLRAQEAAPSRKPAEADQGASRGNAMRKSLLGLSYDEQRARLSPSSAESGAQESIVSVISPGAGPNMTNAADTLPSTKAPPAGGAAPAGTGTLGSGARPMLRTGSSGDSVIELQSLLNHTDEVNQSLHVDGQFGPLTLNAVRQFQAAHPPLVVDGVVGPLTWGALDGTPGEAQAPEPVAKKLYERGTDAYEKGDFAHAYDLFTSADEHVHLPALTFDRAQSLRRLGARSEEAIALYEQYVAEGGARSAEAAGYIVELKGPGKSGDEAADAHGARALWDKGRTLYEAGDYSHAYEEFTKADQVEHRAALTFDRAQALKKMGGRREEAIALYDQYIAEGTGSRLHDAINSVAEMRGPSKTGVEEVDAAAAKDLHRRGSALYDAGDYAHAFDEFTKSDNVAHRVASTFNRAQALRMLGGRRDEAIALYEAYLAEGGGTREGEARFYRDELRTQGASAPPKAV